MKLAEWRASRTARTVFWASACFAFVMAILPHPPEVPGEPNDKVQHIAAFATLALLGSFAYPRTALLKLFAGLHVYTYWGVLQCLRLAAGSHDDFGCA